MVYYEVYIWCLQQRCKRYYWSERFWWSRCYWEGEGNYDLSTCPVYKSLFPKAKTIEYYHHYVCGYDVLVVDGKFHGELSRVEELLAFQYHTGEPYKDFEDLESKYFEYLESYERWSFLP